MCESVERYAEEYAKERAYERTAVYVKNLMNNMKWNMEQALNALNIQGDARANVIKRLQEQ